jgi:hypothetical protein
MTDMPQTFPEGHWGREQHHPAWSLKLIADPQAVVAINGTDIPVTATLLSGPEAEPGLQRFLAYPMYQSYRTRTDREPRRPGRAQRPSSCESASSSSPPAIS